MEAQITERFEPLTTPARLYEAALKGDINSLLELFKEDPYILERWSIGQTSSSSSSFMQSPLHVAAKLGHLEMVKLLLVKSPDMCLARDQDGRNPIHVAAIRGQKEVLGVLLHAMPQAARERTKNRETVLHLCVKHCQLEALEWLIKDMGVGDLLNSKDNDGNTLLHLAVAAKQPETVNFLVKEKQMEKNKMNLDGMTAKDIWKGSRKQDENHREIRQSLEHAKASLAKDALKLERKPKLETEREAVMVVASLIATMAFQVGLEPPVNEWKSNDGSYPDVKRQLLLASNTMALTSSLSVILLLISGLHLKPFFVFFLNITMWTAITATALSYCCCVLLKMPDGHSTSTIDISLHAWEALIIIIVLAHIGLHLLKFIKKRKQDFIALCKKMLDLSKALHA